MWDSLATRLTLAVLSRDEEKTQHAAERRKAQIKYRAATFAAGCKSVVPTWEQGALLVIRLRCDGCAIMIQYIRHGTRLAHWKQCTRMIMHCFGKNV